MFQFFSVVKVLTVEALKPWYWQSTRKTSCLLFALQLKKNGASSWCHSLLNAFFSKWAWIQTQSFVLVWTANAFDIFFEVPIVSCSLWTPCGLLAMPRPETLLFLLVVLQISEKRLLGIRINLSFSFSSPYLLFKVILTLAKQVICHFMLCLMEECCTGSHRSWKPSVVQILVVEGWLCHKEANECCAIT